MSRIAWVIVIGVTIALTWPSVLAQTAPANREVAVTIDDLPEGGPEFGLERMERMTYELVGTIHAHRIPVTAFVNEAQLSTHLDEEKRRTALLDRWLSAGIELGNHTFSHRSLLESSLEQFEGDVIRGEFATRSLSAKYGLPYRYFRHPYVQTGRDLATRTAFERFLADRGYTIAPVTMSNDDWVYALVYADAKSNGDRQRMMKISDAYLAHTEACLSRAEVFSNQLFQRQIREVLLVHANELNAEHFAALMSVFEKHGYVFVSLAHALEDAAYSQPNDWDRDEGVDWFQRWAFTRGVHLAAADVQLERWVSDAYEALSPRSSARIPGSRN